MEVWYTCNKSIISYNYKFVICVHPTSRDLVDTTNNETSICGIKYLAWKLIIFIIKIVLLFSWKSKYTANMMWCKFV